MTEYIETDHAINQVELKFLRDLGLDVDSEYIFHAEQLRKRDRQDLSDGAIESIQNDVAQIKSENKSSKVISLIQFPKGIKKTFERVEKAMRCSMFNGTDGICIYETYSKQSSIDFSEELDDLLRISGEGNKYLVLEMDGEDVRQKLASALKRGLKNFIFIAGAYKDNDLWIDLIEKIRKEKGKSFVVFLKRMHIITKKAYITQAVTIGANLVVHGMFVGRKTKNRKNYYMDTDGFYKEKSALSNNAVVNRDQNLKRISEGFAENSEEGYPISRVCSLKEGKLYCKAMRRKISSDT
jgi:hypothetical protein